MKPRTLVAAVLLALLCAAGIGESAAAEASAPPRAFTARDLVLLARLSEPRLSPDGRWLAYTLRETDWDANKGVRSIWRIPVGEAGAQPVRLTAQGSNAGSARWSPDGRTLYFLSDRSGSDQVWSLAEGAGEARQVTHFPVDVQNFRVSPDGSHLALSLEVFPDCANLDCTKKRLAGRAARKASGVLHESLFVRHWDAWADGRRNQLYVAALGPDGAAQAEPLRVSAGVDGDIPSKPFGDESEYSFSPDGRTLYFDARAPGSGEAWSTNFDVFSVPADASARPRNLTAGNPAWDGFPLASPDGRFLYYLAMKRAGFEADRFGIRQLDLASGARREVDPAWDRSAGPLSISPDGRTLYTTADDLGEHALFAVDVASGRAQRLAAGGNIADFSMAGGLVVVARDSIVAPTDLYLVGADGSQRALTAVNAERLRGIAMSPKEDFWFAGWNGEKVRGYVVKPFGAVEGRKYPVAFLIHGGPQGSWIDDFHYRWNPEVYAGAGYAVVVIDFHGSTGYGQAFTDAISGHWGDRPLEDLRKGWAAALAKYPFLAGDRACALGASYGGYMIDWIAGNWNTPDSGPWRCLVSHDGGFDTRFIGYATEELWFTEWENGGTPWDNPREYERFNPATHTGDWKVPMLIVHGARDYRVPLDQGIAAFTVLQRRGIPSQFLEFPDENHWVLKPQNSLQWNEAVQAWLKRWTTERQP